MGVPLSRSQFAVGDLDGWVVGPTGDFVMGPVVGADVPMGLSVGAPVGLDVTGSMAGLSVGAPVGFRVTGLSVGPSVGALVGLEVTGLTFGSSVGASVGLDVAGGIVMPVGLSVRMFVRFCDESFCQCHDVEQYHNQPQTCASTFLRFALLAKRL